MQNPSIEGNLPQVKQIHEIGKVFDGYGRFSVTTVAGNGDGRSFRHHQKVGTDANSGCRRPSVTIEIPLFTGDRRSSVTIEYFGWLRMLTFRNHPKLGHVVGYEWLQKDLPSPSGKWLQKFFHHHFISHGAKFWMVTERTFCTHRNGCRSFSVTIHREPDSGKLIFYKFHTVSVK